MAVQSLHSVQSAQCVLDETAPSVPTETMLNIHAQGCVHTLEWSIAVFKKLCLITLLVNDFSADVAAISR